MYLWVQGGDESKLTSETLWESLKAVKEKHAHKVDSYVLPERGNYRGSGRDRGNRQKYLVCTSRRQHPCLNPSWVPGGGVVVTGSHCVVCGCVRFSPHNDIQGIL